MRFFQRAFHCITFGNVSTTSATDNVVAYDTGVH